MNREQLMRRLAEGWADLEESRAGLSAAELARPGVAGDWSVRDVLAHVSWWEEEALEHLPTILAGGRPPRYADAWGGIDAFNAAMTERWRALSLAEVLERQRTTHARLVEYLETVPEEEIATETRFRRRLRLDTWSHYPLHARAIREWRAAALSPG
ncbi:MAG TPA: maleylpyruvate isomerase N-terminal domain-containing protein [Thermomicrobiales bacterium]|nr:maleylpyruvate isomerase N-terminal domain-containing protein [Thermomicrobiales bacterium]